jgi:uncharacterized protein YggE
MQKLATTLICICYVVIMNAQVQGNFNYNKTVQQQSVNADNWPCGDRQFTAASDVMIYVPPDAWILELYGTEEQPTLESAQAKLQVRITAFQKKLNAMGIANEDITVTTVSQEKIQGWTTNAKGVSVWTITSYSLTKSILIRYTDPLMYNRIISAASEHMLDNVQQHYCTVADEQAVYAELYRQAMEVCMQKRDEEATFYNATISPTWNVSGEYYDVQLPAPGVYVQPGTNPQLQSNSGYDRVISPEYGTSAVRYSIHLEITYTLTKPQSQNPIRNNNSPVKNK